MIVVSDTSPVRALANLTLLPLLKELYIEVIVPPAVATELRTPPKGQNVVDLQCLPFVRIQPPSDKASLEGFLEALDLGEAESLALALELKADLVLIDESAGRAMAKQLGLVVVGVLGVLLEAKRSGFIEALSPLLDRLQNDYHFYLTSQVRPQVLHLAGESA